MAFLDRLFGLGGKSAGAPDVRASLPTGEAMDLHDPRLAEFITGGLVTAAGETVTPEKALRNPAVQRCVTLISGAMGMMPLGLFERGGQRKPATEHSVGRLLGRRPNSFQTPSEFKRLLMVHALLHGNGYARIVRTGQNVSSLLPLVKHPVTPKQAADGTVTYEVSRGDGGKLVLPAEEVFHLRGMSLDGIVGVSPVKLAAEAVGLAFAAEKAAASIFSNGMMAGGALTMPGTLSDAAQARLKATMDAYRGSKGAGQWVLFEEGLELKQFGTSSKDAQHLEMRAHQIEEVLRVFGVPRSLAMMDDTSWGSGIEALGRFFVSYGLAPWMTAWEEAIGRSLLTPAEAERLYANFDESVLLRGSMKEQAEFYARALGSGGHQPWATVEEVREQQNLPAIDRAQLGTPSGQKAAADGPATGTTA